MEPPEEYGVIDCETTMLADGERPKTLFWGLATENLGYHRFNNTAELSEWLLPIKEPKLKLLHHSNFDIIQLLLDGVQSLQILRSHNTKIIMSKWGEHLLLNSHAMFPTSLGTIFESFGYKKTPLDDLEKRNYEDCVYALDCFLQLDEIFKTLVSESPLSRHTVASTGFHAAERLAGKMPKDLRFESAYRGGRCEIFDTNEIMANKFDINSSYPASFVDAPGSSELLFCDVESDCWYGPFFDYSNKDKLLFPAGKFKTWVYRDVFEKYIEPHWSGTLTIRQKHKIDLSWLKRVAPLVQKLYELKNRSDGGLKIVCKFLLNAMYGRIGLRGLTERTRILPYIPDGDDISICQLGPYGKYIVWDKRQMVPRSNYPLAAYITDNARGRLYKAFVETVPAYGDTDSVFTAGNISPAPLGSGLGEWKSEGQQIFKANNLKDYWWHGHRALKGGEKNMQWTLKRMAAGRGAVLIEKEFSLELRKRELLANGLTNPLVIE